MQRLRVMGRGASARSAGPTRPFEPDLIAPRIRRAALLVALVSGACGGPAGSPATSAGPATAAAGQPIEIRARVMIAATPGSEPIATGEIREGSTLGGAPFCEGGTVVDNHGSTDPAVWLINSTLTCPDGTLVLQFVPDEPDGDRQTGTWTVLSGTGAYDGLAGSGTMLAVYDPDPDAPTDVTFTGTVTP